MGRKFYFDHDKKSKGEEIRELSSKIKSLIHKNLKLYELINYSDFP